ncbi:hypothetical protein [Pseudomonas sp.]|uniref:hypothetical protein n=1 Tax=Pseudomonas sp. TaxID=306 RepID=UPI002C3C5B08|nr:hypothetical protein [Pseudomonas sp.]HUE93053.1 hypothetical protein [Pseudomonas sp.]
MNTDESSLSLPSLPGPEANKLAVGSRAGGAKKICLGFLLIVSISAQQQAWAEDPWQAFTLTQPVAGQQPLVTETASAVSVVRRRANFKDEQASLPARQAANWVVDSGDNLGMPFMIVDKAQARVLLFDANGQLNGSASALLGLAVGDDSVPGIGTRKLSSIRPEERTTPAGRFVVSLGRNLQGKEILWVDYENAISLHRVATGNAKERRAERLASANIHDKRISYGCINVPVEFFDRHVSPAFSATNGVVYVLPETRANNKVFASYYAVE